LFSREDVANYLNQNFEPAWEMVRAVPIVRIDFGNGTVTTRTLHGNVASYVCGADGQVVDILPGLYTPDVFTTALRTPHALTSALVPLDSDQRLARLRLYHQQRAQVLRNPPVPVRPGPGSPNGGRRLDVGKGFIEMRLEARVVQGAPTIDVAHVVPAARPRSAAELASWQPLVADTLLNETQRRLQIHDRLAGLEWVRPEQIKRWVYRDVLRADLDDPHMGLGEDFFADIER
jgi:hypothetical protein